MSMAGKAAPRLYKQIETTKFQVLLKHGKDPSQAAQVAQGLITAGAKNNPTILNTIAWSYVDPMDPVEKPDLDVALAASLRAVELTEERNAAHLDTLARVYWMRGEREKARATQEKALSKAQDAALTRDIQSRLDEYSATASK
jgi:hypothetical protein